MNPSAVYRRSPSRLASADATGEHDVDQPTFLPASTAAISCMFNGALTLSVYTSDGYVVTDRVGTSTSGWQDGTFNQPGNAVSATSWADSNGVHIRVYCTIDDATTEWCQDDGGDWYKGQYTLS